MGSGNVGTNPTRRNPRIVDSIFSTVTILVLDIGGSNVKLRISGENGRTKIPTGPDYTPKQLMKDVAAATKGKKFDAVSIGVPSPVVAGKITEEPQNLGPGWADFRFKKAFGKPVKLVNDAAMQAVGAYEGGRMLFLSLGTGLGSALVADHHVIALELCELRWSAKETIEDRVNKTALLSLDREQWEKNVHSVVKMLRKALLPDSIAIGGGGAKFLSRPPKACRLGNNSWALAGGERLWSDRKFRI
jgi:predicted NBD/HSP70 family sugar kinase